MNGRGWIQWTGLALGPLLALVTGYAIPDDAALGPAGRATAAMAVWMAVWWLTEALPLAATALLPLAAFPLLGIASIEESAAPYGRSLIFLFLGGFLLGLAMQRWGLHRRLALLVMLATGPQPRRLIAGLMLATAFLSMWISNTATVIMLVPIATSLLEATGERCRAEGVEVPRAELAGLGALMMLSIAYAASIGGAASLIGTPPNLVLAGFLAERYGVQIGMVDWLAVGLPLLVLFLPLAWLYLTRLAFPVRLGTLPGGRRLLAAELHALGAPSRGERIVLVVFALAALAWLTRPALVAWTGWTGLSDAGIAVIAALALFAIPVDPAARVFALDWDTAKRVPWEILILFGGGLSLANAISANGVDAWLGGAFAHFADIPEAGTVAAVSALVVMATELTSNTAVTASLLPVVDAAAPAAGVPPGMLLLATALSASCAFMLPVATPPNAIVYGSGYVTMGQMVRAGIGMNVIAVAVVTAVAMASGDRFAGLTH